MCFCSRLMKTLATRGRSSDLPVSFSTIEASVTISPGDLSGRSASRFGPDRGDRLGHRRRHVREQRVAGIAALEHVGVGQQRALARRLLDVADQQVALVQALDDLLAGQPLRDRQLVLEHAVMRRACPRLRAC